MRKIPSFEQTSKLVARALGVSRQALSDGFQPVGEADVPQIVDLRRRALGPRVRWDDEAYLRWRYHLGSDETFRPCELWQLKLGDRLIGIVGREFSEVIFRGQSIRGHRGMDLLIDPAYESSGAGVWLSQVHMSAPDFAIAVGANPQSVGIIQHLYAPMPARKPYLLPIDFGALLRRYGLPRWTAAPLGLLLNALEPVMHRLRRPSRQRNIALRPIERFTPALLDTLAAEQIRRAEANGQVEILRSAALLNWRLLDNPRARYEVLGAFEGDDCVGYVAFRPVAGPLSSTVMHVIDWLTIDRAGPVAPIFERLLYAVAQQARRHACASVQTVVLHPASEAVLRRNGYVTGRQASYLVMGLRTALTDLQALASAAEAWCITDLSFDSDGAF